MNDGEGIVYGYVANILMENTRREQSTDHNHVGFLQNAILPPVKMMGFVQTL
jgi:hypothetical protein